MKYQRIKKLYHIKNYIKDTIILIIGCAMMAFATSFFLLPNQLSSGGFTGIATALFYLFKWPVGTVLIILNTPLYILAYFRLGKSFLLKGIIGTISLATFIDIFTRFSPLTADRVLGCIYGGIIMGIGSAVVLKPSGSTGGSDLLAYIIKSFFKNLRTSSIIVGIDIAIITFNVLVFRDIEIGLYSAITIYIMGKMIDIIYEGIYFTKMIFVVSKKYNQIADEIQESIKRGITGIHAKGMYTDDEKMMLWIMCSRNEYIRIKQICKKIDKDSFIVISTAREAYGMGFKKD